MDDATSLLDLPDDPAQLKRVIAQQRSAIDQIKREAVERIQAMEQKHKTDDDKRLVNRGTPYRLS